MRSTSRPSSAPRPSCCSTLTTRWWTRTWPTTLLCWAKTRRKPSQPERYSHPVHPELWDWLGFFLSWRCFASHPKGFFSSSKGCRVPSIEPPGRGWRWAGLKAVGPFLSTVTGLYLPLGTRTGFLSAGAQFYSGAAVYWAVMVFTAQLCSVALAKNETQWVYKQWSKRRITSKTSVGVVYCLLLFIPF